MLFVGRLMRSSRSGLMVASRLGMVAPSKTIGAARLLAPRPPGRRLFPPAVSTSRSWMNVRTHIDVLGQSGDHDCLERTRCKVRLDADDLIRLLANALQRPSSNFYSEHAYKFIFRYLCKMERLKVSLLARDSCLFAKRDNSSK